MYCTIIISKRKLSYVGNTFYTVVIFHHKSNICGKTGFSIEAVEGIFLCQSQASIHVYTH